MIECDEAEDGVLEDIAIINYGQFCRDAFSLTPPEE